MIDNLDDPGSLNTSDWHWQLRNRITTLEQLEKVVEHLTVEEKRAVIYSLKHPEGLKMAITPYFASLMDKNNPECPIRKQMIPSMEEFRTSPVELYDPCGEEKDTVVANLVHRYPDRVLLLVTDKCAAYCRHCTRRRIVGSSESVIKEENFQSAVEYIKRNNKIRDVLISGGDPLLFSDDRMEYFIKTLHAIDNVEMIRIGTRVPVTLPQRITNDFCNMLKKYQPIYISIHINHPNEITEEMKAACGMLADNGIVLGSQTVLLKGINDRPQTMMKLMHELLKIRVRPYYIYQCDLAPGTGHFRTSVSAGIKIIQSMRGYTTGYALPTYVIDAPGGGGKVPIGPDYVISKSRKGVIFKNYESRVFVYPENGSMISVPKLDKIASERNGS
ncbi:MAG: hypothetical protein AUJ85_02660 [Elusimicrobia bacterium CG1_02_37_114]|nr:MAG: hypothetical protein AUJ85_02660 [Elusimicrobia bacterium CG1_02_37_114]PIZ12532.1 MAG: lysine 2,3-aminomutase [Elusimicrobia bacterium CG_4_10_14_0_8_um_filter_37_32]